MANHENVPTPWGKSQGGTQLALGITMYHTAGHGGVKVIKKLNQRIPVGFHRSDGWYEEDCDSQIVYYFFYDEIESYMRLHNMPGWSISADEYFGKFTRAWFKEAIERWNVAESIYHFGTIYPPERLDEYGRDRLEQQLATMRRKDLQPIPKTGDCILFREEIAFMNGESHSLFNYERGNIFRTPYGQRVRIRKWQDMDYITTPALSCGDSMVQRSHGGLAL
jgi:hypothetical protein